MRSRPWWQEVLLPATDRAIAIEAGVLLGAAVVLITWTWRWESVRLVFIGAFLIVAGLFGARAAH